MTEGEESRRTPHARWAAGAAVLLAAIAAAAVLAPSAPAPVAPPPPREVEAPRPSAPESGIGRVVCGFCDGDGRIDAVDLRRQAPRLDVQEGPCAACAGKGGR